MQMDSPFTLEDDSPISLQFVEEVHNLGEHVYFNGRLLEEIVAEFRRNGAKGEAQQMWWLGEDRISVVFKLEKDRYTLWYMTVDPYFGFKFLFKSRNAFQRIDVKQTIDIHNPGRTFMVLNLAQFEEGLVIESIDPTMVEETVQDITDQFVRHGVFNSPDVLSDPIVVIPDNRKSNRVDIVLWILHPESIDFELLTNDKMHAGVNWLSRYMDQFLLGLQKEDGPMPLQNYVEQLSTIFEIDFERAEFLVRRWMKKHGYRAQFGSI
jgi:hypothetical protein